MAFPWGSVISAGGRLLGGLMGQRNVRSAQQSTERWNQVGFDQSERQFRELQDKSIQNRVKDAKAAGLHPLFALGASPGSATSFYAGQHPTGSGLGTGIARAAEAVGRGVSSRGSAALEAAQLRAVEAGAMRDEAAAAATASAMKRAEHAAIAGPRPTPPVLSSGSVPSTPSKPLKSYGPGIHRPPTAKVGGSVGMGQARASEGWSAEDWEEQYGEVGGLLGGVMKMLGDSLDTLRHNVRHGKGITGAGKRRRFSGWRYRD